MPGYLESLLADMEAAGRPRAKWLVGDVNMGWSFEVAKKFGIRVVSFWPAATACLAFMLKIPKLAEDGLIDDKGNRSFYLLVQSLVPITDPHKPFSSVSS
jgi:hypothetical protein